MFESPATVMKPRLFGRGKGFANVAPTASSGLADDLRLFAITFAGGFLFMTVFLA
jgi:hypothetical protein